MVGGGLKVCMLHPLDLSENQYQCAVMAVGDGWTDVCVCVCVCVRGMHVCVCACV